ncbi:UNVERIFIED_CONTAM: hypothetical protein Sradi_0713000 [Sesamum radiatum]|uniref:Uncharacterized protein n=1 Tax=Sesamum radiatum TaxID=300843 RepID=A0AAW2VN52_SESRA
MKSMVPYFELISKLKHSGRAFGLHDLGFVATVRHEEVASSGHMAVWAILQLANEPAGRRKECSFRFEAAWLLNHNCVEPQTEVIKQNITRLKEKAEDLASKEETLWKQRAKAFWLAEGDRNTRFFHAQASEHKGVQRGKFFQGIKERIWKKINSWSFRHLSQAGRVVLIKSVLLTIPSYVMSCFRLPDSFQGELESMMAEFFWSGGGDSKAWRIAFAQEGSPLEILSHKYFPCSNFFEARLGANPSFTWRSLVGTRELLTAGLRWQVGDGAVIPLVGQPWLPRPSTFQLVSRPATLPGCTKVVELISASGGWDVDPVRAEFCLFDAECILSIRFRVTGARDEIVWHYGKNGRFSVRSAYRAARALYREAEGSGLHKSWNFITSMQQFALSITHI